jgi:hypothetical protein
MRIRISVTLPGLVACLAGVLCAQSNLFAQDHIDIPLNSKLPVVLGGDLGFGKKYRLSMARNFQDWGVQSVAKVNGHPVRVGERSIRFETREGFAARMKAGATARTAAAGTS